LNDYEGEVKPEEITEVVCHNFLGLADQHTLMDVTCYELHHDVDVQYEQEDGACDLIARCIL